MTAKKEDGALLRELEAGLRRILLSEDVSTAERLRAIETGAKLLMIRYRIEAGEGGEDGKFFSKTS